MRIEVCQPDIHLCFFHILLFKSVLIRMMQIVLALHYSRSGTGSVCMDWNAWLILVPSRSYTQHVTLS